MNPLVSIIIPAFNRANYIVETLESVKSQTYANWECLIVDDGSTDDTVSVVKAFIATDSRFQLFTRPAHFRSGGNGARNYGFLQSKGDHINFLDSDDKISTGKIEKQVAAIEQVDADICLSNWTFFNAEGFLPTTNPTQNEVISNGIDLLTLYARHNFFIQTGVFLLTREIVTRSGLFLEALKVNQDGEFFFRILLNSSKVATAEGEFLYWRMDSENKSSYEISEIKFRHRIESWKLIDAYIKIYEIPNLEGIIKNAKAYMFRSYSAKAKNLIDQNAAFFSEEIRQDKLNRSFIRRLKNKFS